MKVFIVRSNSCKLNIKQCVDCACAIPSPIGAAGTAAAGGGEVFPPCRLTKPELCCY